MEKYINILIENTPTREEKDEEDGKLEENLLSIITIIENKLTNELQHNKNKQNINKLQNLLNSIKSNKLVSKYSYY